MSRKWLADRALLLVHGIGNAKEGDYAPLQQQVEDLLAQAKKPYAVYVFYYDYLNDWFAGKEQVKDLDEVLRGEMRKLGPVTREWNTAVDFIGDIVWPVLLADARDAIQTALRRQLLQMIADGKKSGIKDPADMHLSIIAHSMGCFHTFETLHAITNDTSSGLAPASDGVQFDNVILMASPVQLIGSVANKLGALVPRASNLKCRTSPLTMPVQRNLAGGDDPSAKRPVTIVGKLDPVGGYLFNTKLPWAYTDLSANPAGEYLEDAQTPLNINTSDDLESLLASSLQDHARPDIVDRNPHSWSAYIDAHRKDLLRWLDVP
jgi:hypothetical protein